MPSEPIDEIFVQVRLQQEQVKKDMLQLQRDSEKSAQKIEDLYKKRKIQIDTSLGKKSISELQALREKLQQRFERQLKLNVSSEALRETKQRIEDIDSRLEGLQTEGDRAGNIISRGFGKIRLATIAVGTAMIVLKKAFDFAKEASQVNNLRITFNRLANEEGLNATELMQSLEKATRGAVKEIDLLKTVNKGSFLGVDLKAMPDLLQFAAVRAQQTGESVDYLVDSIITGLGRKSPLILDNLGLTMKDLDAAVIEVAKDHGRLITEVDELSRSEYLVEAAVKVAREELKKSGKTLSDLNLQTDQLSTNWDKVTRNIGDLFIPVFSRALVFINAAVDGVRALVRELNKIKFQGVIPTFPGEAPKVPELDFSGPSKSEIKNFMDFLKEGKRFVPGKGIIQLNDQLKQTERTAEQILKDIEILEAKNLKLAPSSEEYKKNVAEIKRLQDSLIVDEKNLTDEIIKRIKTENELRSFTTGLSIEVLESAKKTLEAMIKITDNVDDQLNLYREIDNITKAIEERKAPPLELPEGEIQDIDITESELKRFELRKKADETLEQLKIAAIESEFDQREALINSEYKKQLENLENLNLTDTEFREAKANLEISRENELAGLQAQRFHAGLSAANQIASALSRIVGTGNSFVDALSSALSIAEAIVAVIEGISLLGSLFGIGGGGGAAKAIGRQSGGPVLPKKSYLVGERGPELFIPKTPGIVIPNNRTFPARVTIPEGSEKQVSFSSGKTEILLSDIVNSVRAVSANIQTLQLKVDIINNAPEVETIVKKYKKIENRLARAGAKFRET